MNFPNDLMYTKSHEWIKMQEDGTALVGLSITPRMRWAIWSL